MKKVKAFFIVVLTVLFATSTLMADEVLPAASEDFAAFDQMMEQTESTENNMMGEDSEKIREQAMLREKILNKAEETKQELERSQTKDKTNQINKSRAQSVSQSMDMTRSTTGTADRIQDVEADRIKDRKGSGNTDSN